MTQNTANIMSNKFQSSKINGPQIETTEQADISIDVDRTVEADMMWT